LFLKKQVKSGFMTKISLVWLLWGAGGARHAVRGAPLARHQFLPTRQI